MLQCVAKTSLRTKLKEQLADQLTDIVTDAVLTITKEDEPTDLYMVSHTRAPRPKQAYFAVCDDCWLASVPLHECFLSLQAQPWVKQQA